MREDAPETPSTDEIAHALKIAGELIESGVPVFAAAPRADKPGEYYLPKGWEKTTPDLAVLQRWQPGWALAAVGGWAADFLDVDPRNGGEVSWREVEMARQVPRVFGEQRTPSGGRHFLISATGERTAHFMPGLDLVAGSAEADAFGTHGRGFVFIAPTVRPSKAPETLGALRAYRWTAAPELEMLAEFRGPDGRSTDDSLDGIVARVHARRGSHAALTEHSRSAGQSHVTADPFVTVSGIGRGAERPFSEHEAREWCRPALLKLREASIGLIEETANEAAATLSHFVPEFWTLDLAFRFLTDALECTAYDGRTWRAEKFLPVLDGRRPPHDNWKAIRRLDVTAALDPEAGQGVGEQDKEQAQSLVDKLLAEMLTDEQLIALPPPKPLIRDVLDLDSEAWLIGKPGSRKTFVALSMAGAVARGQPWQGLPTTQAPVVMIVAEGASGIGLRVKAYREKYGPMGGNFYVLPRPVQAGKGAKDGQLGTDWLVLVEACRRLTPGLVIIDTQARVTVGLKENVADEMGVYILAVSALRQATGACVLTIHHSGRQGDDARGSSAIDGAQGTELRVTAEGDKSDLRGALFMDKQKDMAEAEGGIPLAFEVVDLGTDPETGRELSSLVLLPNADPFATASGVKPAEEWESKHGTVQVQAFRVLIDQGGTVGLTKAEARRVVAERWYRGQTGRDKGLRYSTWDTAWTKCREKTAPNGDPVMVNVEGEKWIVDQAAFRAHNETLDDLQNGK